MTDFQGNFPTPPTDGYGGEPPRMTPMEIEIHWPHSKSGALMGGVFAQADGKFRVINRDERYTDLATAERVRERDYNLAPDNPAGQEANVDTPGVGYPVLAPDVVAQILRPYPKLFDMPIDVATWLRLEGDPHAQMVEWAWQNRGHSRAQWNANQGYAVAHRGQ